MVQRIAMSRRHEQRGVPIRSRTRRYHRIHRSQHEVRGGHDRGNATIGKTSSVLWGCRKVSRGIKRSIMPTAHKSSSVKIKLYSIAPHCNWSHLSPLGRIDLSSRASPFGQTIGNSRIVESGDVPLTRTRRANTHPRRFSSSSGISLGFRRILLWKPNPEDRA